MSLVSRSARTRSFLLAAALLAALGALSLFVARAEADVPLTGSALPLPGSNHQGGDGNQDDESPFTDWQHLDAIGSLNHYEDPNASDTTFQSGNSAKVGNPAAWNLTKQNGGSSPGNVNVFDAYSRVATDGDTFLHVAFTREATSGTAYMGFELNKRANLWNNGNTDIPCRTDGDVVVTVQVNGNDTAMLIEEWDTSTVDATSNCAATGKLIPHDTVIDNVDAQGSVNDASITNYLDEGGPLPTDTIAPLQFAEASVNLTRVLENALGTPCFSFGSIWMHTRASTTPTSDMKDYIAPSPLIVRSCAASGTKFHDLNADGVKDAGEPGLPGFRMFADFNNDGVRQAGEPFGDTDANGDYTILVEPVGDDTTYRIREQLTPPATGTGGWTCSAPTGAADPVDGIASFTDGAGGDFKCGWGEIDVATKPTVNGKNFGNYRKGKVVIKKVNVGGTQADAFPFTTENLGGAFNLAATNATGHQITNVVPNVNAGSQTYSVTEGAGAPADAYNLTALDCDDTDSTQNADAATLVTRAATIKVSSGETVTCTFTNTRKLGKLEVVKTLEPATDGGLFNLQIDGTTVAPNVSNNGTTGEKALDTGSHTVAETAGTSTNLTDYVPSIECRGDNGAGGIVATANDSGPLEVSVTENSDIVCVITNKRKATVTIVKDARPNHEEDFDYTTSLGSGFTLDDDAGAAGASTTNENQQVVSGISGFGSQTVTEGTVPGWTLSAINCNAAAEAQTDGQTVTVKVDPGDDITCTFVNKQDATVEIVKDATPADGTDFDYAGSFGGFMLDDGGADDAVKTSETFAIPGDQVGSRTVTEAVESGWTLADITCSDDAGLEKDLAGKGGTATLDVDEGDQITCTFFNKQDATVEIVKDATPADGTDFDYAGSFGGFMLDDGGADDAVKTSETFAIG